MFLKDAFKSRETKKQIYLKDDREQSWNKIKSFQFKILKL